MINVIAGGIDTSMKRSYVRRAKVGSASVFLLHFFHEGISRVSSINRYGSPENSNKGEWLKGSNWYGKDCAIHEEKVTWFP